MNPVFLKNKTDEEVLNTVDQSGIYQIRAVVEMIIRLKTTLKKNTKATKDFNKNSSKQTQEVINLTKWLLYLTIIIGLLAFLQLLSIFVNK
ncbi:MAG: hypothetical protein WCT40_04510 [Candidatus Magasanikbacteria bacterium]|jgi:hypothetical protein